MKLSILLILLSTFTTFGAALQGMPPPKRHYFCGWMKDASNATAPDCASDGQPGVCLSEGHSCNAVPRIAEVFSVVNECHCDFYIDSGCNEVAPRFTNGTEVDLPFTDTMNFYTCHRLVDTSSGSRVGPSTWSHTALAVSVLILVLVI